MDERKDVTVPMPKNLNDRIEARLGYGDSKSEWIREAIRQRLERDEATEGNPSDPVPETA